MRSLFRPHAAMASNAAVARPAFGCGRSLCCHRLSSRGQPLPWIGFLLPLCTSARNILGRRRQHEYAVVSGLAQGSGEYFASVGVGTPPTPALLVLDTGSDVVWLQCAPCRRCYALSGRVFGQQDRCGTAPQ